MTLRPIGTEFEYCYPPSTTSNNPAFTIWVYRVIGHAEVDGGAGSTRVTETIFPLSSRRVVPDRYVFFLGEFRPVPPPECAALLDEGWKALALA